MEVTGRRRNKCLKQKHTHKANTKENVPVAMDFMEVSNKFE